MRSTILSTVTFILPLALAAPFNVTESLKELVARGSSQVDRDNALAAHNLNRGIKGEKFLTWDNGLMNAAQAYADHLAATGQLVHGSGGENLYWSSAATDHDLLLATQSWVNEVGNYHGEVIPQGDFEHYGHYTQVVWSSTQRVGMGATRDSKGGVYVVARYDPPGNYVGQKPF